MDVTGIGGAVEGVADLAKSLVDRFLPASMSDGEKAQKQIELQEILSNRENAIVEAKKSILIAELNQSDSYTKRARPTIIYGGLLFIFLNYVAFPIFAFFSNQPTPAISLPSEFWMTWGGVCGVYVWGRTKEKQGVINPVLNLLKGK